MQEIPIKKDDAGQRLDRFLRKILPNIPLSHIYRCLRKKAIKVNHKKSKPNYILAENDRITLALSQGEIITPQKQNIPSLKDTLFFKKNFLILHEDSEILILNKPSGLVVHPGTKYQKGQTLIDLAQSYLGTSNSMTFQPSLVHRLDKETSGIILIAKTADSLRALTKQLRTGQIKKEYCCLVTGHLEKEKGIFSQSLLHIKDFEHGGKMQISDTHGKISITRYSKTEQFKDYTLVSVSLDTGRTHQIRIHFSANHNPVAGDKMYGTENENNRLQLATGLARQFLHAHRLEFIHPRTKKSMIFTAPLPIELEKCLHVLRQS